MFYKKSRPERPYCTEDAAEAVDMKKQKHIRNAARYFLSRYNREWDSLNFQVIEISIGHITGLGTIGGNDVKKDKIPRIKKYERSSSGYRSRREPGLPYFNIVGLADTSVKEASERVRRAIRNSGFEYPKGRITVNLSPAYIHKRGSHFDLGIALGILSALQIITEDMESRILVGELSFDGSILPVTRLMPMLAAIVDDPSVEEILLAEENCREAFLMTRQTEKKLIPVKNLSRSSISYKGREKETI